MKDPDDAGRRFFLTTSWDDGDPRDLRLADLLARHDVPGTFYVPRSHPGRSIGPGELRTLAERFEVGAHTLGHVDLTAIDLAAARAEIEGSKRWVEDVTGVACTSFCFPGGRYRREHLPLVRDAGYAAARTVEMLSLEPPRRQDGVWIVPTTVQAFGHAPAGYLRNVVKRRAWRNLGRLVVHYRWSGWTATAASLLEAAARAGGVFHLWGHSWEIDEHDQWRALEEVLRRIGEYGDGAERMTVSGLAARAGARADGAAP
jgi:peptidoglycan/xylan/chitin deacetylase (PgdA/CDA1 family)